MRKATNITGQKFSRLTVIERALNRGKRVCWHCICECGTKSIVNGCHLQNGHTKSCGCLSKEKAALRATTHGMNGTSECITWKALKSRCNNPNNEHFSYYGGRGISVCQRWDSFENFYADMGLRPSDKHSIDRIDNDGNYDPSNCRWATKTEQAINRRLYKTNKSGVTGVQLYKNKYWQAMIGIGGEKKRLYFGTSFQSAVEARMNAERKYWNLHG